MPLLCWLTVNPLLGELANAEGGGGAIAASV
jgi:hypothetical protein